MRNKSQKSPVLRLLNLLKGIESLTKLIRAIRIFPLVFQLMVDDTRKMSEHKASMDSIPIGMNVSQ